MTETINPFDILKRLYTRYYPGIALLSLLSLSGAYIVFPGENIPLIVLLFHTSQFFCWFLIVLSLRLFYPNSCISRVVVIVGAALLGVLISYMGLALYLNFNPFQYFPSSLSGNIFIMMLLVAVLCSGTAILAERSLGIEKTYEDEKTGRLVAEEKLAEDQLSLLQAKIEPQFLFNTMESICRLYDSDPEKANTMQMYFIQYLRATLVKAKARIATIEQEIDHIRFYMNVFKVSMEGRLKYEIEVDPKTKDLHFPPMIVQPIIENLIRHGREMANEEERIFISVRKREDMVHIRIADTARRLNTENNIGHILANIKERLKTLYEDKWSAKLEDNQPTGIAVDIEVPCG